MIDATLPNVRSLFVPDFGMLIAEIDLDRADAHVVAWEAGAERLKERFRSGADIHKENANDIFGAPDLIIQGKTSRYMAKRGVHATNYGVSARTLGINIGVSTAEAQAFIDKWLELNPEIADWHERVEYALQTTRQVRNPFGFRRLYLDRISPKLINEALAWVPQSTVAIVTNLMWANIEDNVPEVEILMQVHDSIVVQFPKTEYPHILPRIHEQTLIEIPYDDPLVIPTGIKVSEKSWGEAKEVQWEQ